MDNLCAVSEEGEGKSVPHVPSVSLEVFSSLISIRECAAARSPFPGLPNTFFFLFCPPFKTKGFSMPFRVETSGKMGRVGGKKSQEPSFDFFVPQCPYSPNLPALVPTNPDDKGRIQG